MLNRCLYKNYMQILSYGTMNHATHTGYKIFPATPQAVKRTLVDLRPKHVSGTYISRLLSIPLKRPVLGKS